MIRVPWARPESGFQQVALMREMPVAAAARIIEVTDKRLWRVLNFYVEHTCAVSCSTATLLPARFLLIGRNRILPVAL